MSKQTEALKLALEALQTAHLAVEDDMLADEIQQAITAIRSVLNKHGEALAHAPEVREQPATPFGIGGGLVAIKTLLSRDPCAHAKVAIEMIDAMLAEQPHCDDCGGFDPECPLTQPAPVPKAHEQQSAERGEPVAWMMEGWGPDCGPYVEFYRDDEMGWRDRKGWTPLYTSPPASKPWVGLTDEEWQEIDASLNGKRDLARIFVKAIEAKLREKNA